MKAVLDFHLLLGLIVSAIASEWDYKSLGLDWADLGQCDGTYQSPINIVRNETLSEFDLPPLRHACSSLEGKFKNDEGRLLKFELTDGLAHYSPNDCLTGGPFGSVKYFFLEFHLHWGSAESNGAEHTIDSNRYPAELHLVHVKEDYVAIDGSVDFDDALEAEDGFAYLAIFIKGNANTTTLTHDTSWFNVIAEAAKSNGNETSSTFFHLGQIIQRINPTMLIGDFNYWYYNGSLTFPGCNEGVRWIVAERPLEITSEQMSSLFELTGVEENSSLINNFRLAKPTNARDVFYVNLNEESQSKYDFDCDCNLHGTIEQDASCHDHTGQCNCDSDNGYIGHKCFDCASGYFLASGTTCQKCECNEYGSSGSSCSDETGACSCNPGYAGTKCDQCSTGTYESSPSNCTSCPNGWFFYDGGCYFAHGQMMQFQDAQTICSGLADGVAQLFEPRSVEENQAIYEILLSIFGPDTEYWIGVKFEADGSEDPDGSTFCYVSDGSTVDISIWGVGMVHNRADHCIAIGSQDFGLMFTDRYCTDLHLFVCEIKP